MKQLVVFNPPAPVFVDDEDYERVSSGPTWYIAYTKKKNPRVVRIQIEYQNGQMKKRTEYLHRVIMNPPKGFVVDHIDGNTCNNVRSNLRIATPAENARNVFSRRSFTKLKGVTWRKDVPNYKYQARITYNRRTYSLGFYLTPEAAARAYDEAALKYFGEFANLNFPKAVAL